MSLTCQQVTCWPKISVTPADSFLCHVADMSADMSATYRPNRHMSVNLTLVSTCQHPTIPARDLCAIINPTLPPSAIAPRVGAALEPRVPPATITRLPCTRVLCPTVSNSSTSTSLNQQNVTTSINSTSWVCICTTWFLYQ
jgi:hypothetical protein